jgi:hypothetical protein
MLAGLLTLAGYMASDLIAGTEQSRYLRGWGRIILLVSDCAALMILVALQRQNLWWFVLGMGVGGIVTLAIAGVPFDMWKLGYGERVALIIFTLAALFPRRLAFVAIAGFGVLNIFLDYRSLGAATLIVAVVMWARLVRPQEALRGFTGYFKFFVVGAVIAMLLVMSLLFTEEEYASRREISNVGRSAGIIVSLHAIAQSPIVGYGSWTVNEEFARMFQQEVQAGTQGFDGPRLHTGKTFRSHSQMLQSWVEGGLLGAAFFLFYGYTLVKAFRWHALIRPVDRLSPMFVYLLVFGMWSWIASPFGGGTRIVIALAVATAAIMSFDKLVKPARPEQTTLHSSVKPLKRLVSRHGR